MAVLALLLNILWNISGLGRSMALVKAAIRCFIPAFAMPFILHGMYDFSLAEEFQALNDNLVFVPFILVFIELGILIRMLVLIRKERHGT